MFPFAQRSLIFGVCVSLTVLAAGLISAVVPERYQTTLLFSVGVTEESLLENGFSVTQVANDFGKTLVGWTRSLDFGARFAELAEVAVSGRAQAQQNFLLSLVAAEQGQLEAARKAATQVLAEEVEKYNARSLVKFFLSEHGRSERVLKPDFRLVLVASLVGGGLVAILLTFGWNYVRGCISSRREVEEILGVPAAFTLGSLRRAEVIFLQTFLKRFKPRNLVLLTADFALPKLASKLGVKLLNFPQEAEGLLHQAGELVVLAKVDCTRVSTLEKIRELAPKPVRLIVLF